MPLSIPEWSGQRPTAKGYLASNATGAEAEIPCCRSRVEMNLSHELKGFPCALRELGLQ